MGMVTLELFNGHDPWSWPVSAAMRCGDGHGYRSFQMSWAWLPSKSRQWPSTALMEWLLVKLCPRPCGMVMVMLMIMAIASIHGSGRHEAMIDDNIYSEFGFAKSRLFALMARAMCLSMVFLCLFMVALAMVRSLSLPLSLKRRLTRGRACAPHRERRTVGVA